jgi:hypothetical protein
MPNAPLFPTHPELERAWLYDTLEEILASADRYGDPVPNYGTIKDVLRRYAAGLPMNTEEL